MFIITQASRFSTEQPSHLIRWVARPVFVGWVVTQLPSTPGFAWAGSRPSLRELPLSLRATVYHGAGKFSAGIRKTWNPGTPVADRERWRSFFDNRVDGMERGDAVSEPPRDRRNFDFGCSGRSSGAREARRASGIATRLRRSKPISRALREPQIDLDQWLMATNRFGGPARTNPNRSRCR